jgi:hypothetical protein
MLELIQRNPLVAIILILVPCIAVAWRLMVNLYVKPRDFRISTLEKHVEELRNEALRVAPSVPQVAVKHSPTTQKVALGSSMTPTNEVLRSLTVCYSEWTNKEKTELQRKKFEESYTGKQVSWDVFVESVDKTAYWGTVWVRANHTRSNITEPRATVRFPLSEEERLLGFKPGDPVSVVGTIKEFFLNPIVEGSRIEKITNE